MKQLFLFYKYLYEKEGIKKFRTEDWAMVINQDPFQTIFSKERVFEKRSALLPAETNYGVCHDVPMMFFRCFHNNSERIISKTPTGKVVFVGRDMLNRVEPGCLYRELRLVHFKKHCETVGIDHRTSRYWWYICQEDLKEASEELNRSEAYTKNLAYLQAENDLDFLKAYPSVNFEYERKQNRDSEQIRILTSLLKDRDRELLNSEEIIQELKEKVALAEKTISTLKTKGELR